MENIKEIRTRIKSIQDIKKITNAMYMIASTKMRKAKNDLDKTKPYFDALHKEIKRIFQHVENISSRYICNEKDSCDTSGTYGLLVITADKGLAGSYNKNVIRKAEEFISDHPNTKLFVVGEYGRRYFSKRRIPIEKSFLYTAQNPSMDRAREISALLLDLYDKGELEKIFIVYSDLKNSLTSKVKSSQLLPFRRKEHVYCNGEGNRIDAAMPFELYPSADAVVDSVVRNWLTGFIYSALVDSFSSEQSARMAAMHSANKNAEKILETLMIQYNQLRQAAITQEITEVISSAKGQIRKRNKGVLKH